MPSTSTQRDASIRRQAAPNSIDTCDGPENAVTAILATRQAYASARANSYIYLDSPSPDGWHFDGCADLYKL